MSDINSWFLNGVSVEDLPNNLSELRNLSLHRKISYEELLKTEKWDFLIRKGSCIVDPGFVKLSRLANTKRGIATGANDFFHITLNQAKKLCLSESNLFPCVGRAVDVNGFEFSDLDLESMYKNDKKSTLIIFGNKLSDKEIDYIRYGENMKLNSRFLLSNRKPWYSMEKQKPSKIWAAVFGRKGMRFIHNKTSVMNLTTFHCVYPFDERDEFVSALTLCLNLPSIQDLSRSQIRVYGGGLIKFEPRDLLDIYVPNLSKVATSTIHLLSQEQKNISEQIRKGRSINDIDWRSAESLAKIAVEEASHFPLEEHEEIPSGKKLHHRRRGGHKHHDDQVSLHDAQPQSEVY